MKSNSRPCSIWPLSVPRIARLGASDLYSPERPSIRFLQHSFAAPCGPLKVKNICALITYLSDIFDLFIPSANFESPVLLPNVVHDAFSLYLLLRASRSIFRSRRASHYSNQFSDFVALIQNCNHRRCSRVVTSLFRRPSTLRFWDLWTFGVYEYITSKFPELT